MSDRGVARGPRGVARGVGAADARAWLAAGVAWRIGACAVLACLVGACGGKPLVNLSFANAGERTVWVAAALVDRPDALDGYSTSQIFEEKTSLRNLSTSVIESVTLAVKPGHSPIVPPLSTERFLVEQGWLVAVALFAEDNECARRSVPFKPGSELTFAVSLRNDCLELTKR